MSRITYQTETGNVSVTHEGITVPATAGGTFERAGRWASLLGQTKFIPRAELSGVFVSDPIGNLLCAWISQCSRVK